MGRLAGTGVWFPVIRWTVVLLAAVAMALSTTGVSMAASSDQGPSPIRHTATATTTGASATCTVPSPITRLDCTVRDTAADSHSVYVQWDSVAGQNGKLPHRGGNGSEQRLSEDGIARAIDGVTTFRWRVCVDVQNWTDRCSDYRNVASGPNGVPIEVYCQDPTGSSAISSCELVKKPEDWFLAAECATAVGEEVLDWATLKVGKGTKIVAKLADSRGGKAVLTVKDVVSGYETVVECTF